MVATYLFDVAMLYAANFAGWQWWGFSVVFFVAIFGWPVALVVWALRIIGVLTYTKDRAWNAKDRLGVFGPLVGVLLIFCTVYLIDWSRKHV